MSTNAAVRTAWATNVFANFSTVTSYSYQVDYASDETAPDKGYSAGILNFFQYIVSSSEVPLVSKRNDLHFMVEVVRIIADDPLGTNQTTLLDDFRTLIDYVNDNLGISWGGTVDLTTEYPEAPTLELISWGGIPAWRGTMIFEAVKEIAA